MNRRAQISVLLLSLGIYLVSLGMPIFMCQRGKSVLGLQVLLTGWLGVLALDPRWIANLGFFWIMVSVIFRRKPPGPFMVLATVASAIASPLLPAMSCGDGAGAAAMSVGFGLGGYLWMLAMFASVAVLIAHDASIPPSSDFETTQPMATTPDERLSERAGLAGKSPTHHQIERR